MATIAPVAVVEQVPAVASGNLGLQASANGGVLLLAQAWAALGGGTTPLPGVRWQGQAGVLLLFGLVALPLLGPNSVLAVATLVAGSDILWRVLGWVEVLAQRRLARFVSSPRHDWLGAYGAVLRQLAHQKTAALDSSEPTEPVDLVVDSTTIEKRYGPKLPGIGPVYDAVQGKLVDGYEVVSSCLVSAQDSWPVGLLAHQKSAPATERVKLRRRRRKAQAGELPSKLDLALALVGVALGAGIVGPTVVGDSGFAVMWFLGEIVRQGLPWLVSTRQDRRLRIGTAICLFREWAKKAVLTCLESDKHRAGVWGAVLSEATLLEKGCNRKGLACRPAYFERRDRTGRVIHRWYLVTSHLDWDLATVWLHWGRRWQIEVWHRTWKQHLQLAQFHVRTWAGINTLLACSSLRASLVVFLQATQPAWHDLSIERLVSNLGQLACLVGLASDSPALVSRPAPLPAGNLWNQQLTPLPSQWWPIRLKVA